MYIACTYMYEYAFAFFVSSFTISYTSAQRLNLLTFSSQKTNNDFLITTKIICRFLSWIEGCYKEMVRVAI